MDFVQEHNLMSVGNLVRVFTFQPKVFVDLLRVNNGFELPDPIVGFTIGNDTALELFYDGTLFMSYAQELSKDVKELTALCLVELYIPKYKIFKLAEINGHKYVVDFREVELSEVISVMEINLVNSQQDELIKEPLLQLTKIPYLGNPTYTSIFTDTFSTLTYVERVKLKQDLTSPLHSKKVLYPLEDLSPQARKQASPYENSIKSISLDFRKKD
ncbi:MAG: hypothetical protein ABS904_00655 [Solibacillus isronensis]